jgi:mRNA-degrading endonuclease RelE of RelBE toxin-antitoxin system
MNFHITDTFTDSLARLTNDEQKAIKTTAFDLQLNPAGGGMSFHKLDKARDKNFWSVRVSRDIRIIVHRTPGSMLLCYVGHHDKAYSWAERRKIEVHPKTGAAQIVELRSMAFSEPIGYGAAPAIGWCYLFPNVNSNELLGYGVPYEWLDEVLGLANEDDLLGLIEHLPSEAAEALLELATGGKPRVTPPVARDTNPFEHPDALRRFRVVTDVDELGRAMDYPWEKWTVFLHPEQRQWVERDYNGPARVSGSAGTGKTIVALHRAVYLARQHPESRVLLATFTDTLAHSLRTKLRRLIGNEPRLAERIDVHSLEALALRLHRALLGPAKLVDSNDLKSRISTASSQIAGHKFGLHFLRTEWDQVVDAWQLATWEDYRDVARLGRRTRLPEAQREVLWSIFSKVVSGLESDGLTTQAGIFTRLAGALKEGKNPAYDFSIIDEAQDLSVSQLRFFAALGADRPNALFFAGDPGQRIFQQPFSWKSLGVDIRGRSRTLRINYRTSHQIRSQADRLLGSEITDADGNREDRSDTISVFNGPAPVVQIFPDEDDEMAAVAKWLVDQTAAGLLPHEFGVFVRSEAQMDRARRAVDGAGLPCKVLDEHVETISGHVAISTMHLAKGLEFRAVAVMACDDEVIPLQERIESVGDDADLQEVYDTERQLLYVACTRARDQLLITGMEPVSEFLDDLLV